MVERIKTSQFSKTFFKNTKLVNGELYFINKFCACFEHIKLIFQFTDLDNIELVDNDEYENRLIYTFSSIVHDEILKISVPISSQIDSLKSLFHNAPELENEISQKYNISFKN